MKLYYLKESDTMLDLKIKTVKLLSIIKFKKLKNIRIINYISYCLLLEIENIT